MLAPVPELCAMNAHADLAALSGPERDRSKPAALSRRDTRLLERQLSEEGRILVVRTVSPPAC